MKKQLNLMALISILPISELCSQGTYRISVNAYGQQQNNTTGSHRYYPALSADGRYVTFASPASNLVVGDTNNHIDVFVQDLYTRIAMRVSVSSSGQEGNQSSGYGFGIARSSAISADGRYVAFPSEAWNLVPGDTNHTTDVFIHDLLLQTTTRVSVSSTGREGNGASGAPFLSGDGSKIVFASAANTLVSGDTNDSADIFVHDRISGTTTRISVSSTGLEADDDSHDPAISADGRCVVFFSEATNLAPNDDNGKSDVFVHELATGKTTLVSANAQGVAGNGRSTFASISGDGRSVVFESEASNLAAGDVESTKDVFVKDLGTGEVVRVSQRWGAGGDVLSFLGDTAAQCISHDGRYVVFMSAAENLVPGDYNRRIDVFLRDLGSGYLERLSVDSSGREVGDETGGRDPAISGDGRAVAFQSLSAQLVPGDTNWVYDVFLRLRAPLRLEQERYLSRGVPASFTVTGAQPGETVTLLFSLGGQGGYCPPALSGACLDVLPPLRGVGASAANAAGAARFSTLIPDDAPPLLIATQALAVRGPGGRDTVRSNTHRVWIQ